MFRNRAFVGSQISDWIGKGKIIRESIPDGLTLATPFTSFSQINSYVQNSGTYYIKTPTMTSVDQFFIDATTGGGNKWIRVWIAKQDDYNTTSYSWDSTQGANLINDASKWMYCFVNPSTNITTQAWYWYKQSDNSSAFQSTPPVGHGGVGAPLISSINATRISDGAVSGTQYLRTGISSFGSNCDDSRSGTWGQICLKAGGSSAVGTGGYLDFPHYATFAYSGQDDCSQSNQGYTTTKCSSTRRFAVYVG